MKPDTLTACQNSSQLFI